MNNQNLLTSKKSNFRIPKKKSESQNEENISKVQTRIFEIKSNKDSSKRNANVAIPSTSQKKYNCINKSSYPERNRSKNVASKRMLAMREQQKHNSLFAIKDLYKDQKKFISSLTKKLHPTHSTANKRQPEEPISTITSDTSSSKEATFTNEKLRYENTTSIPFSIQQIPSQNTPPKTSACNSSMDEVESMDWEEIPEQEVINDIYSVRQAIVENPDQIQCNALTPLSQPNQSYKSVINIVIDTNILLSKLSLVDSLLDMQLNEDTKPLLVIPWMVLQELDVIKTTTHSRIDKLARSALRYLNEKLRHSQLKGQSAIDASDQKIECQVPDDHILNCCLQLKTNNNIIILLSNDINLRNKALACEINAYHSDEILEKLHSITYDPNRDKLNQRYVHLQHILKGLFKHIIQKEMQSAYGDVWKLMVKFEEDLTVPDLTKLIIKYWVAVYSFVYPKHTLLSLNQLLEELSKYSCDAENLNKLVETAVAVCLNIKNVSTEYNSIMNESIHQLKAIIMK